MNMMEPDKTTMENFTLPDYTMIPDVGLYLKQVVKYINDAAGTTFGFTVTDSMLSNYVKMHIVPSPIKKQYYREHIALLLFISMAKSVLSLENIARLVKIQQENYTAEIAYAYFKSEFEAILKNVYGLRAPVSELFDDSPSEKKLLRNIIITMCYKFYLDDCFRKE